MLLGQPQATQAGRTRLDAPLEMGCWHLTERANAADKRVSEVERELATELSAVDNDAYNAAKVASAVVLLRMIPDSEDQQVDGRVREAITVLEEYRCAEGDSE